MNAVNIITELRKKKIALQLDGDQLRLTGETKNISPDFLEIIKQSKPDLIEFLRRSMDKAEFTPIDLVETASHYPLSNAQQRLWILSQLEGGNAAYNIVAGFFLEGTVDKINLNRSFKEFINRHETLRTSFIEVDGNIVQAVREHVPFEVDYVDISGKDNISEYLTSVLEYESQFQFDLQNPPLLKVRLLYISPNEYALAFVVHHIVSDGWSVGVMINEVMKLYEGLCQQQPVTLEKLRIQYKDYVAWLNEKLSGDKGRQLQAFWKKEFEEIPPELMLATDFPRSDIRTFDGLCRKFYLDNDLNQQIIVFCRQNHVTRFAFFQSVLAILLSKYSQQYEIVIGTPVSGRNHFELENQFGLYVNTLPLKSTLDMRATYADFLQGIAEYALKVFEYQEYPFDKILDNIATNRNTSRNPLFDVMLVLQNTAVSDGSIDVNKQFGFDLNRLSKYFEKNGFNEDEKRASKFDLTFYIDQDPDGRQYIEIEYATQLFKKETINQLHKSLIYIIDQVIDNASIILKDVQITTIEEQDLILNSFNKKIESFDEENIFDLIAENFDKPDAHATITYQSTTLSYEQLKYEYNKVASVVLDLTKGIYNPKVCLLLGRSEWILITILGVMRAGAAYVPIDIKYPSSRIAYMIADADADLVIVDDIGLQLIPQEFTGKVIHINEFKEVLLTHFTPPAKIKKEDTAYIIYTSGSTGQPKGVIITHKNAIAFLKWAKTEFGETDFDILYATTSYCFDLSVFEFLFPLTVGKSIRILESGIEITDFIDHDTRVMINTVPSVVRSLLDINMSWQNVAALNMAGEPVPRKIATELASLNIGLRNLYGPTEDTTYSTVYHITSQNHSAIPIGKPIDYTSAYILDEYQNLMPVGVSGEICLSGHCVAAGYLKKPELTAAKFITNKFSPSLTLYRTGDFGKWSADGNIEFLGRKDEQVKVRGYRIELDEIQFYLEQYDGVQEAIVTVTTTNGEDPIITGYWIGDDVVNEDLLKKHLKNVLPAYMVPQYLIQLDTIPLTSNGKVDKKNLPVPFSTTNPGIDVIEPQNEIQANLLEIWKQILNKEKISINDNFFSLGGHSLKAVKLKTLVLNNLNKALTLNEIFLHPTIIEQAGIIADKKSENAVTIPLAHPEAYYPISFSQQRLFVLTQFNEASVAYNMPAVFEVEGNLDIDLFQQAFRLLIEKHESLRTTFGEREGVAVQFINADASAFNIDILKLEQDVPIDDEHNRMKRIAQQPFDLLTGPLVRCTYIIGPQKKRVLFSIHHIVADGWSIGVLYNELKGIYRHLYNGHTFSDELRGIQYKDYAVWQKNIYQQGELQAAKNYWIDVFKQEVPKIELPTDSHRPTVKTYNGNEYSFQFNNDTLAKISALATKHQASLFMFLITSVSILIKKYANQNDLVIGTPVAGREQQGLEKQIGLYINTLPLRIHLEGEKTFEETLAIQKQVILDAFTYQNYPFEILIEDLNLKGDPSRSPLFDVMLVLQNTELWDNGESWNNTGLTFKREVLQTGVAKYDLTFTFTEAAEGLLLQLEYNSDLFKGETIAKMAQHLNMLFTQVVENPARQIKHFSLISDEERILASKSDFTEIGYDHSATIISLFKEAAQKYPENTAVEFGNISMTYREIDKKSDQLAWILVNEYGIRRNDLVLLFLERSEWIITAILATLKAGATYVPIDPAYPDARINYIISDTGSKIILTDKTSDHIIQSKWSLRSAEITSLEYSNQGYVAPIEHTDLAYIIYTSGTTGNPKGVLIEHGNVTRLLFNDNNYFDFNATDRWVLFHSYCFDVSVWEMYGALLNGGCISIITREQTQNSMEFYNFLIKNRITILNQTPTAFRSLVHNNIKRFLTEPLKTVRYVIFAGEALMPQILKEWVVAFPTCKAINMYGITETTVHVTYRQITIEDIENNKSNIGVPLPTLSCRVLDIDLQPVPVNIIGELCVGGAGVARGYLNKEVLTAERFIHSPFKAGETLYRSGDYVKILPTGDLEYIGRKDDQVKIRGHRIELAEIQTYLINLDDIKDAIIIPVKSTDGDFELVGYFISEKTADVPGIRKQLKELLPAYMVPSYLIPLDAFPVNNNGKLDKTALPKPNVNDENAIGKVTSRNDTDSRLIAIWENVLDKKNIGIQDNFFDLGGHSLKAARVISRIHEEIGVKIDLKNLFIDPTIEYLSNYIETVQWMENQDNISVTDTDEIVF